MRRVSGDCQSDRREAGRRFDLSFSLVGPAGGGAAFSIGRDGIGRSSGSVRTGFARRRQNPGVSAFLAVSARAVDKGRRQRSSSSLRDASLISAAVELAYQLSL